MTKTLSVVRMKDQPDFGTAENSVFNAGFYLERHSWPEIQQMFSEWCASQLVYKAGKYIKSGGGQPTTNIQEAQIFGWSRNAKENLKRYDPKVYDIIPITIIPTADLVAIGLGFV